MFDRIFNWLEDLLIPSPPSKLYILVESGIYSAAVVQKLEKLGLNVTDNLSTAYPEIIGGYYKGVQCEFFQLSNERTYTLEVSKYKVVIHDGKLNVKYKVILNRRNCKYEKPKTPNNFVF